MKAFAEFELIEKNLEIVEKHRAWLLQYEGCFYSIALDGKHKLQWEKNKKKYRNSQWDTQINCISRLPNRTIIEFDDDHAKENLEKTYNKLKEMGFGFIRSTHKGKCDYLWIEFSRKMRDDEIEQFLTWIAPQGSEIDLNFASSKRVFPVLYAPHWKYSDRREIPIEYFKGKQIDFDLLGIPNKKVKKKIKTKKGFNYKTFIKEEAIKKATPEELNPQKIALLGCYKDILNILMDYSEINEKYYPLISIWIIGTYFHNSFPTFPYLFFNAMKGSGKSRVLKLITCLSHEGSMLNSITEAVLFRTKGTLGIDEFEGVTRKGSETLRELLNSAYKKGITVKRMRKSFTREGEEQKVEEFEVYRPIVMCNISGMDEVLGDRCINMVLERSNNPKIIKKMEIFHIDTQIQKIKEFPFEECRKCRVDVLEKLYKGWNNYINNVYSNTIDTINTNYISNTNDTNDTQDFFKKIDKTGIDGRNLELAFPLLIIASWMGEEVFEGILNTFKEIIEEKKKEDVVESLDVSLIDFVSQEIEGKWISLKDLFVKFSGFIEVREDWFNEKWLGRALKRLNLLKDKKRMNYGRVVLLDVSKAQQKIKLFK